MTSKNLPKIGYFNGRECDIISRNGGWTEILDHDGKRRKVRNGEVKLEAPKEAAPKPVSYNTSNPLGRALKKAAVTEADYNIPRSSGSPVLVKDGLPVPPLSATIAAPKVEAPKVKRQPHNGDEVGRMLEGATLAEVYLKASHLLRVTEAELLVKYGHLNPGQQRMNLGNRMRGYLRKVYPNPHTTA